MWYLLLEALVKEGVIQPHFDLWPFQKMHQKYSSVLGINIHRHSLSSLKTDSCHSQLCYKVSQERKILISFLICFLFSNILKSQYSIKNRVVSRNNIWDWLTNLIFSGYFTNIQSIKKWWCSLCCNSVWSFASCFIFSI